MRDLMKSSAEMDGIRSAGASDEGDGVGAGEVFMDDCLFEGDLLRPDSTMFPPWIQELMFTTIFFRSNHFTFEVTNCDLK